MKKLFAVYLLIMQTMEIEPAPLAKNNEVRISIKTTQFVHTPLHTLLVVHKNGEIDHYYSKK